MKAEEAKSVYEEENDLCLPQRETSVMLCVYVRYLIRKA
jgi:hypothetical protein